jgi:hypothetical protein
LEESISFFKIAFDPALSRFSLSANVDALTMRE